MKTYFLLLFFLLLTVLACKKDNINKTNEELSKNPPEMPAVASYDLNNDSIDDVKIEYKLFTWDGSNASGDGIDGTITTLNDNEVLLKRNEYTLFSQLNDILRINPIEPNYWTAHASPHLVSISSSIGYLWPKTWAISSNKAQDSYYIGIKILKENIPSLGWLKLEIDSSTGSVKIVDKQFTPEHFIIIDR